MVLTETLGAVVLVTVGVTLLVVLMLPTVFVAYVVEVCVGATELVTVAVGSGVTELLGGTVGLEL